MAANEDTINAIKNTVAAASEEATPDNITGKVAKNPFGEEENPFGVVADSPPAQEPKQEEAPVAEPAEAAPQAEPDREGDATEQRVPYDRFAKQTEARRVAEAHIEKLKQENAELREKTSEVDRQRIVKEISEADSPDGFEDWAQTKQQAWVAAEAHARLQELGGRTISAEALEGVKTMVIEHRLMKALGLSSGAQVDAVGEVWEASGGGISETECLSIARARDPELFAVQQPEPQEAAPVTMPQSHTSLDPAMARATQPLPDAEMAELQARASQFDHTTSPQARLHGLAALFAEKLGRT
jgi:hypothetical protein